jgi:hypothetical protein
MEIPKHIYMCHKIKENVDTFSAPKWQILNPDYKIHTYGNEECIAFLRSEYGQRYVDIFNHIRNGPIKGDFWRVCILYKYGGVYADADIDPLVPISEFLEQGVQFLTSGSYQAGLLNPHFIVSVAGNPVLKECIDSYVHFYNTRHPYSYWGWSITNIMIGPLRKQTGSFREGVHGAYQLISEIWPTGGSLMNVHCSYKGKRLMMNRSGHYNPNTHNFNQSNNAQPTKTRRFFNVRTLSWR